MVYKIPAQVARLKTLTIDFSIILPIKWYIATLVPRGATKNEGLTLWTKWPSSGMGGNYILVKIKINFFQKHHDLIIVSLIVVLLQIGLIIDDDVMMVIIKAW